MLIRLGIIQLNLKIEKAFEGTDTATTFEHYLLRVPEQKGNGFGNFVEGGHLAYCAIMEDDTKLSDLRRTLNNKIDAKFVNHTCHNPRLNR